MQTRLVRFIDERTRLLAAIVLVAVKGLINIAELRHVWRVSRYEFVVSMVAAFCAKHSPRFIGFAGVDPHKGMAAVRELETAVRTTTSS